jgi:hypothetical protein
MKTTFLRRFVLLASLLILSLLVLATGIQAAQAATVAGTGAGSGTAATPTTTQDGWLTAANTAARDQVAVGAVSVPASGAQSASSDTSSTTAWIAVGSVAAVLLVGFAAWALMRRRQPGEFASAAYCEQHLEDPLCSAV